MVWFLMAVPFTGLAGLMILAPAQSLLRDFAPFVTAQPVYEGDKTV